MAVLPNVAQYTKNLIKSTVYASGEMFGEMMPGITDFKDANKEVLKSTYVAIRDYRKTFQRVKEAIVKSKVYEAADVALKNLKSDLATGDWYNHGRQSSFEANAIMGGIENSEFNIDESSLDTSFDESALDKMMDFGESEFSEEEMNISEGDAVIAKTVKDAAGSLGDVQVRGIDAMLKSNRAAANFAYVQGEKLMKVTQEGFDALNQTASSILQFNTEGVQKYFDNSAAFFTETQKLAQERNAMLKELVEMQRNIYKMYQTEDKKQSGEKKFTFNTIASSSGMVSLEEYGGNVLANIKRALDDAGMGMINAMGSMAGENPLLSFAQNPLGDIVKILIGTALGPAVQNAAKSLDSTASGIFGTFISKMNKMGEEDGPLGLLGKILGVRDTVNTSLSPEQYKRGAMPWDGESKKALTEVIPHYLANIEAALTGRHQLFDYQTGRYVDSAAIRSQFEDMTKRYRYKPFSELDQIMRYYFSSQANVDPAEQRRLAEDYTRMKEYWSASKGRFAETFQFNEGEFKSENEKLEDLAMEIGVDPENLRGIIKYLKQSTSAGDKTNPLLKMTSRRGVLMNVSGKIMQAREDQNREMQSLQDNNSIMMNLFNGGYMQSRDRYGILRNNMTLQDRLHIKNQKDDKGNNIFYYLQNIYKTLVAIKVEGFNIGTYKPYEQEETYKKQRRKLSRGVPPPKPPAQPTSNDVKTMLGHYDSAISEEHIKETWSEDRRRRESQDREDQRYKERMEKYANERKQKGIKYKGPELIGYDDPDNPNADKDGQRILEMSRLFEKTMILNAKQSQAREDDERTWLGKQWKEFKEGSKKDDKDVREEINKKGFLDALIEAGSIGDKWNTIRVGLQDLSEKPSTFITTIFEEADEKLYKFFFEEEEIEDKRTGKKYKGFFGRLRANMDNLFVEMNEGLNKYLFQPLKDKLGVEGPWDAIKKGLNYVGIDAEAIGKNMMESMSTNGKAVWDNIKDSFKSFFQDAIDSIEEDERKMRELEDKDKTVTGTIAETLGIRESTSSTETPREEENAPKKESQVIKILSDPNASAEAKARALRIPDEIITRTPPEQLEVMVDKKVYDLVEAKNKKKSDGEDVEIDPVLQGIHDKAIQTKARTDAQDYRYLGRFKSIEDRDAYIQDMQYMSRFETDKGKKISYLQELIGRVKSDNDGKLAKSIAELTKIDKSLTRVDKEIDEFEHLSPRTTEITDVINSLALEKSDLISKKNDELTKIERMAKDGIVDQSLYNKLENELKALTKKTERDPDRFLEEDIGKDSSGNRVVKSYARYTKQTQAKIHAIATHDFASNDFDLFREESEEGQKRIREYISKRPEEVFNLHKPYLINWIKESFNLHDDAAIQYILNKMLDEFKRTNGDIESVFKFKVLKTIAEDIAKAYDEGKYDTIVPGNANKGVRIGRAIKDSFIVDRLTSVDENADTRQYWHDTTEIMPNEAGDASRGITGLSNQLEAFYGDNKIGDLFEDLKTTIDDNLRGTTGAIAYARDAITEAINGLKIAIDENLIGTTSTIAYARDAITEAIDNLLQGIKETLPTTGTRAEGRGSLELAPPETAVVSKGEIIKPIVGPSEKITKTGLYNLGRGDAVIPNPSEATRDRNKIEESNKLSQISKDLSTGKSISQHMASSTKMFAEGRDFFDDVLDKITDMVDIKTGEEAAKDDEKDDIWSVKLGSFATGRPTIKLDTPKEEAAYTQSVADSMYQDFIKDMPKYAEGKKGTTSKNDVLAFVTKHKDKIKSKNIDDPKFIQELSELIKNESDDNKWKQNKKTTSSVSEMLGYLVDSTKSIIGANAKDTDLIQSEDGKSTLVSDLKESVEAMRQTRMSVSKDEIVNGVQTSVIGKAIGDGINNFKGGLMDVLAGLTGIDSKQVKEATAKTYEEVKQHIPNVIAKGTLGLVGGTILGGPLVGAMLGAGLGVVESSETFRTALFGTAIKDKEGNIVGRKDDGLIDKEVIDAYKKYSPAMKGYGLLGTIAGLITPFGPLGGALIGAGIGAITRTDEFQDAFFGKKGIFDKDTRDFIKKAAPNAAAAAVGMAFLGPFGLVGNLMLGGATGFMASTEQFKTALFGAADSDGKRTGGIVGAIKQSIVDPWLDFGKKIKDDLFAWVKEDVFAPLKGAIAPIGKQIQLAITGMVKGLGQIISHWTEVILGKPVVKFLQKWIMEPASKFFRGAVDFALKPVKAVLSAPSKIIGGIGNMLKRRQIQMGNADYMTAAERLKFREDKGMRMDDQWTAFDTAIATSSTDNLATLLDTTKIMQSGDKELKAHKDKQVKKLWATIDSTLKRNGENAISDDQKVKLEELLMSDNKDDRIEANHLLEEYMSNLKIPEKEKGKVSSAIAKTTEDLDYKKQSLENFRTYGMDMVAKEFKEQLGVDLDTTNIGKFTDMLEKELRTRKKEDEATTTDSEDAINDSIRDQTSVLSAHLVDIKKVLEAMVEGNGIITSDQVHRIRDLNAGMKESAQYHREKAGYDTLEARKKLTSVFGKDRVDFIEDFDKLFTSIDKDGTTILDMLLEMGSKGYSPESLNTMLNANDKQRERLITMFNKVGLQTGDLKSLEGLTDQEFQNILTARAMGLDISDMSEAKDLTSREVEDMLYIRNTTGLSNKELNNAVLKRLVRSGKGAVLRQLPKEDLETFIDPVTKANLSDKRVKGNLYASGQVNMAAPKVSDPNTIANSFLNFMSTSGTIPMGIANAFLRNWSHNPKRKFEGVTSLDDVMYRFAGAEATRDVLAGQGFTSLERSMDPEAKQANAEAMQGINALVAKYQEQGIPDAEIEKTLDVKIRRTEDGGYKVTDNQRIKYDNDEIKGLSNEYSYDAFNKFLSMLMSTPGMQEEMARQLMSGTNATFQDLAGGIQQGIVRTAPAATKRQSIEDIFSNFNFNKRDIDDFKHGISTDETEKMLQVLLDKGITEDEIQKYRSYAEGRLGIIRGYASGGGPSTMTRLRRRYRHTRDRMKLKWESLDPNVRDLIKDQTVGNLKDAAIEQAAETLGISPYLEQLPEDHPIRQIQEYTDPSNLVIKGVEQISPETAETMKEIKETKVIDLIKDSDVVQSASDTVSSTMDSVISGISHSFSMLADMIQKIPDTIQSVTHTLQTMPVDQMVAQLDPNMVQSALKVIGFAEGRPNVIEPGSMVDGYGINIKDIVSNVEANKNLELSNLVSGDTTFGYEEEEPEVKVQPITIINQAPPPIPTLPEEAKEIVTVDPKDVIPDLESEKNLRMLVAGTLSQFKEMGFYPNKEALDKLDYTKGIEGLYDSGFSLKNLYGPTVARKVTYSFEGANGEDVVVDPSFYEDMNREDQVAMTKDLLKQMTTAAFKNGIVTLPTPDGPTDIKIADMATSKSLVPNKPATVSDVVERTTEYGIIKGTTTTDGSIRPVDKDSKEIVGKIELDHTSRVHTAGVLDEIKDLLVDFLGGNKPKKEQEKRSFWDMLKDLLMLLAAFLLSGGLASLIEGGLSNLANILGQIIKKGIKDFKYAIIDGIERIGKKIDKAIDRLKVKLSIKKHTIPEGPKGRGFAEVMKRDAELLAARMKGFQNPTGYDKGKGWKDKNITDERRAEYEKLKAKSEFSLTETEKANMAEFEKMIEREAEINQHLAKIREGGLGAMSTEELDKFSKHIEAHPESEARATLFDEMHKAKLEEIKKYPDKFYQQMLDEHTNEIREGSARRVKWFGASALTDVERDVLANRFANMGMGREQILEIMESMKKDKGLIGAPVERIQAIPGAAKDAMKTMTETVGKEFKEATTAMKEGFHTATEPIRTLGNTIGEKFDKAVQPIKDLGSSIKERVGNIREGITDTARNVGDRMVNGMSAADEASVREYLTKQGFSEAEIESKIKEINASRRTVLGRAIDFGRDLTSGQADLNMGETGRAVAEEGGILSRLGNVTGEGVAKAAAIGATGAGALYKLAKTPFEAASKIGGTVDKALLERYGMTWKVGGFVPKLILGAPGFAVDSIKATAATGQAIVKGGLSTGFAEMAQASRMGALKAMEEGSIATTRMGKAAEKIGEGAMKVGDTIYSILSKILGPITSALSKLTAVLPGGIGQRLSKGFARFSETFAQDLTKVVSNGKAFKVAGGGARMLMGILGKVCLWYTAFELTKAVYNGFANPGVILHIKNQNEVSNGVRVVAAVANAISVALLELVEPKTIADLVIKHLGPIVGFGEKEQKMAEESEAEFLQWKQQEGNADKSFEDFLKDSGTYNDNDILTNITNFTAELPGFVWERVKEIFNGLAQIPPFIFGKISELGKGIFNIGESIQSVSQYWNKLSDRSAAIARAWGKLSPEELEALNKTVEIDPNDPLFGIKNTMKDFASQHWFIMSTVGWAIGKVGEAVGSVVGGVGNVVLGIKDGLSGVYEGVIEGDPMKIMTTIGGMNENNESSGIGGFLGRAIVGPISIPAFFVSTGVLVVKKIGEGITTVSNSFDKLDSAFSYTDTLLPLALNGDLKGLMNTNPFRFSTAKNNGTYTPGDTLAGIVVDLSKLPLIPVATFNLVANNLGKFFQDAVTSLTGRKFDMSFYDGYKLKSLIDEEYIGHAECPFDPKAPLATGIPSALETIYKLFSYPSKAIGYVFEKISTGPSFISDFVKKIKNFFGSLDDIDKQNKDIGKQPKPKPKEEKKEDKPKAESSADTLAPSTKVTAPTVGANQPLSAPGLEAYKKKIEAVETSLSDDEKKIYDDTLKNLPAMSKVRAGNLKRAYEKDQDVKKLLDSFRSDSSMTEYRDAAKKALKDKGLSPNDEVIEIMLVNLATGKNVFGKGINLEGYSGPEYNKIDTANDTLPVQRAKLKAQREYMIQNRYQQNAPGNEKIRYNISGDTKVDTVAARSCAQFSMGAAKDYLSKTPTNMAKELTLGKKYLAKDDGTKFDYFKDSGSRSGYKVTQTSDMSTVDKATSDPNKAVVSMVDTGQGMHYQTYTDKITKGGKQYYKTTDPEKPVQTLTPVDVANRQQKMSFVIQRGSKLTEMRRRAFMPMYGRGNTMSVEPQSGPTCTIHSTKNILRAYTGKEPDFDANDQSYFGSWYSMLKSDLNIEEKGFSKDQRSEFEAAVKAHFDAKPNNPILLYQTGGDGSGNDPLIMTNRCSGNHATVLGRKLSDGTYEDYDSNGGIVHKLKLNEIFDPSAQGSSRNGTSYADANLLMIPTVEPSSPIDHWVGGSGESAKPDESGDSPAESRISGETNTNNKGLVDQMVDKSPIAAISKLYNILFSGGETGSVDIGNVFKSTNTADASKPSTDKEPTGAVADGYIPKYKQFDPQWEGEKWPNFTNSGCAPTSVAIQAEGVTGKVHTPKTVSEWAVDNGLRDNKPGLITGYAKNAGYEVETIDYATKETGKPALKAMEAGKPVIIGLEAGALGGLGGNSGHYLVGQAIQDGKILINNPGRNNEPGNEGFEAVHTWDELIATKPDFYVPKDEFGKGTSEAAAKSIMDSTVATLSEEDKNKVLSAFSNTPYYQTLETDASVIHSRIGFDSDTAPGYLRSKVKRVFAAKEALEREAHKYARVIPGEPYKKTYKHTKPVPLDLYKKTGYGRGYYEDWGMWKGPDIDKRAEYVWGYLKNLGLSDVAAAGVMGNWRVEDPPLEPKFGQEIYDREIPTLEAFVEETGGLGASGYGIAQWTYPTRQEDLMKYAKAQGLSSGDLDAQLGYANQEAGQGVWDEVNQDTDPADSAEHFMRIYENPSVPHLDRRRDEAVQAYNNFSGKTFKVDTPPKSDTPSASIAPSNSDNGITKAAKSGMSLIDKYLLPALDEAIKQSGYYELLKQQYGIDVQSMNQLSNVVSGGNITATVDGEPANTPNANAATTPAEPANTPNAGAASGESVGQAMINYGPEGTILTSLFGPRTLNGAPDFHNGVDIGYDEGTPVYSPITATVDGADYEGGYGNYVVLKDDAGKYYMFAHLSQHSVKTGQTVKPGDQLGLSGNTGHSFGAHLHFGVHDDAGCLKNPDTSHNPMEYPLGKGTLASDATKNASIDSLSDFTKGLSSITTEDIDSMAKMQYGKGVEDFTPYTINDRAIPTGMLMDNLLDFANDTIAVQRSKILAQYEFMRTQTAPKHVEDFKPYTINDTNIPEGMLRDNLLDPNNDTIAVQRAKILAQYEFMRDNGLLGKGTHFEPYTIHDRNIPEGMLRDNLIDYENDTNAVQRDKILAQYKFMKENDLLDIKTPSIPDNKIDTTKTHKDFKPYTINDTDIPEGILRDNLIDPINDTISVQRDKTRAQYEFMRDHNLLPTEETPTDVTEPAKTPSAEAHTPIVDMKAFKKTHEALLKRRMEQITGKKPSMLDVARKEDLAKLGIDPTKTTPTVPTDKKKKPSFLEKLLGFFFGEEAISGLFDDKGKKPSMLDEARNEDLTKLGIDPLKTTPPTVPTDEKKPSMLDEARNEDLTKLGIDPLKTTPPTVPTDEKKKPSFLEKLLGLFTGEGSILNSGIFDDKGKFDKSKLKDTLPSILGTLFGSDTAPEEEDTVTFDPMPKIEERIPKKEENPLEGVVKLVDPFQVKNIVEGDKVSYDGLEDIFKTKQQPTEEPKGFDLGSIFGGESGGLGSIFSGKGFDLGGLFGGESGSGLGSIFGGEGFNLGNLFGGGLFDDKGKFNKGSIPGLVGGLINTFGLFGEHSEEYKAKKKAEKEAKKRTELEDKPVVDEAKRYEDFKPYTINDKDIPEGMLKDNLIDYDNDTISVQRDKKQAQYNFMKENNLLPDTKTPDVPTPDNKVETAKVPEDIKNKAKGFMDKFSKDLAEAAKKDTKKPAVETPKEEEAKPTPPAAPKVEDKEETPEERERKAKEQIVQGTGDHMHLEATVGEKQPAISDSKIDQLLAVLGVIAENTTKLVQLASGGSDTGSSTTINASRTNISTPPKDFNPQSIQGVLSWMGQIIRR